MPGFRASMIDTGYLNEDVRAEFPLQSFRKIRAELDLPVQLWHEPLPPFLCEDAQKDQRYKTGYDRD
jgi:hypothetical protein